MADRLSSSLAERTKLIRPALRRLQRLAPDANREALRQLAELDVLCAELLVGRNASDYLKAAKLRLELAKRLRLVPPLPRARASDEDELNPSAQHMRDVVEREERARLEEAGVI